MAGRSVAYGVQAWVPKDIKPLRRKWSLKKCEKEMAENEKYFIERMTELGYEVWDNLLPLK